MKTKTCLSSAAVLFKKGEIRLLELEVPELLPGQVLVSMCYSGVCHSQLLEYEGKRGHDPFLPHVFGHEGSGKVVAVGGDVSKVRVGDPVVVTWIKGKGKDVPATRYLSGDNTINSGAVSTFMTLAVISENRVVKIPAEMPLKEAALLGCMIPTGGGIVRNTLKIGKDCSVAVFGAGGIGLSAVMMAHAQGAYPVIAVDIVNAKLDAAKKVGATHGINPRETDLSEELRKILGAKELDYAIEAAGKSETMENAFQAVRPGGGTCVIAGNLEAGKKISIDPFELIRGKKILGTWGGETDPDRDIPVYADLFLKGKLPLELLIGREYGLREVATALADLKEGRVTRALLKMGGN